MKSNISFLLTLVFASFVLQIVPSSRVCAQWVQTGGFQVNVTSFAEMGDHLFAGTWGNGVFFRTDAGADWVPITTLQDSYLWSIGVVGTSLLAGTDHGIFLSRDTGKSWGSSGLPSWEVTSFAQSGSDIFAGTYGGGVYRSTDNGASWNDVNNGALSASAEINTLTVNGTDLYAGLSKGGLLRSTNNGLNWSAANNGLYSYVRAFAVLGEKLFAGTASGVVYVSTNKGAAWQISSFLDGYVYVNSFAVSGGNIFAGSYGGVILSTDSGATWKAINSGITDTAVYSLRISGSNLFAGTFTGGVFRRPLSEIIGQNGVATPPRQSQPVNIYPNPVTHETRIRFSTSNSSQASVTIHDLLGREVAKLLDGPLEAGEHSYTWDAKMMPAGVYSIRLQTAGQAQLCPMVIVR
jgi:photosystem II stability/assembly factor-like uncharacterized protein